VACQTVVEARFGAMRAGWGKTRVQALEDLLHKVTVVPVDARTATITARLRLDCLKAGHPLHQPQHSADLWIAATAVQHNLPLVAHDGIFINCPGLELITELRGVETTESC
jgi:predicted nucleic acid-binding protein